MNFNLLKYVVLVEKQKSMNYNWVFDLSYQVTSGFFSSIFFLTQFSFSSGSAGSHVDPPGLTKF